MVSERELDERDEYLADAAWEAAQEDRYWNCEHENWSITDNGIEDVEFWKNGKKLDDPIAWIEIECDDCGRTNHLKVPYSDILTILRKNWGWDELNIDEDRWSE